MNSSASALAKAGEPDDVIITAVEPSSGKGMNPTSQRESGRNEVSSTFSVKLHAVGDMPDLHVVAC